MSAHSASLATRTPNSAALLSFDPAPGPADRPSPAFAASVTPGASVVLAGLLDTQADSVIAAYDALGMKVIERGSGEWCVLVLTSS